MSPSIKALAALIVVQTALLFSLYWKIVSIEGKLPVVRGTQDIGSSSDILDEGRSDRNSSETASIPTELQLRKIIREELAAQSMAANDPGNERNSTTASESIYTAENRNQLDLVDEKLQYFESVGRISGREMQDLQAEIAKLHNADQKRMLSRLVRTMNAGDIKGRL